MWSSAKQHVGAHGLLPALHLAIRQGVEPFGIYAGGRLSFHFFIGNLPEPVHLLPVIYQRKFYLLLVSSVGCVGQRIQQLVDYFLGHILVFEAAARMTTRHKRSDHPAAFLYVCLRYAVLGIAAQYGYGSGRTYR